MPRLRPRRERFCQEIVKGLKNGVNYTEAYKRSGYRGTDHVAEVGGSRLMSQDEVRMRIAEISRPAVRQSQLSLENLISRIERAIQEAAADRAHGAVAANHNLILKIIEMVQANDAGYAIGGGNKSASEIMDILLDDLGVDGALEMADRIREAALARASDCAQLVPSVKVDESEQ
jgi:hypothetical protein